MSEAELPVNPPEEGLMEANLNNRVDVELLIDEVKKRPMLYKDTQALIKEKMIKRRLWLLVCQGLCKQWKDLTPKKKRQILHEVQTKWRKLTNSFIKNVSGIRKRALPPKKNRKCYFNNLAFLIPADGIQVNVSENNNVEDMSNENVLDFGIEHPIEEVQDDTMPARSPPFVQALETAESTQPEKTATELPNQSVRDEIMSQVTEDIGAKQQVIESEQPKEPQEIEKPSLPTEANQPNEIENCMQPASEEMPSDLSDISPLSAQEIIPAVSDEITPPTTEDIIPSALDPSVDPIRDLLTKNKALIMPASELDKYACYALMLIPSFRQLNDDQWFYVQEVVNRAVKDAGLIAMNPVRILQSEIKYAEGEAGCSLFQDLNNPLEESHVPPKAFSPPRDDNGKIIYPETDHEDMDEE